MNFSIQNVLTHPRKHDLIFNLEYRVERNQISCLAQNKQIHKMYLTSIRSDILMISLKVFVLIIIYFWSLIFIIYNLNYKCIIKFITAIAIIISPQSWNHP